VCGYNVYYSRCYRSAESAAGVESRGRLYDCNNPVRMGIYVSNWSNELRGRCSLLPRQDVKTFFLGTRTWSTDLVKLHLARIAVPRAQIKIYGETRQSRVRPIGPSGRQTRRGSSPNVP
jgi:hypothetical protein